ncbi:unnamed protein product [Schistocephalus solidus]|uniref:Putative RNA-binding protein 15 n=1 Tax=Schistocephalus solidus TaxID=70667 RepID=A0A183TLT6_SCHSO|nr:unnamed protein product [Schistocephalus solidus]
MVFWQHILSSIFCLFSVPRTSKPGRNAERYVPNASERLLQNFAERPTKIDPVFAAAAAAAALNAGLVPGSSDFASLANNVSRNFCSPGASSSAAVAAVAAAAMNAAALAAAFGGAAPAPGSFERQLPRYDSSEQYSSYRQSSRRRSPSDRHAFNYRKEPAADGLLSRRPNDSGRRDVDRNLSARFPYHLDHKEPEDDPTATRTLFVGNLPPDIREAELRDMFERFGILEDVDIKRPLPNSNSNAYAFLKYVNLNMAHRAKLNMSGKTIGQFTCKIGYGKVTPTRCLWIGGLGPWIKYPSFAAIVERIATPEKIIWPSGKTYAHIMFSSVDTAEMVASTLRGYPLGGNSRKLRVDFTDESHMLHDPLMSKRRPKVFQSIRPIRETAHVNPMMKHREHRQRGQNFSDVSQVMASGNRRRQQSFSRSPSDRSPSAKNSSVDRHSVKSSSHERLRSPPSECGSDYREITPYRSKSAGGDDSHTSTLSLKGSAKQTTIETAKCVYDLAACLPTSWNAVFVLKKSSFSCRMHILRGHEDLVDQFIPRWPSKIKHDGRVPPAKSSNRGAPKTPPEEGSEQSDHEKYEPLKQSNRIDDNLHASNDSDGSQNFLRISQRMKMDPFKLDDVSQRMKIVGDQGYCVLLAMPLEDESSYSDSNHMRSARPLRDLINYLSTKDAAGVVLLNPLSSTDSNARTKPTSEETSVTGVLHVLPPCDFAYNLLSERAVSLQKPSPSEKFLVILLIRSCGFL